MMVRMGEWNRRSADGAADGIKIWVIRGNDSPKKAMDKKIHPTYEVSNYESVRFLR
jgi:hypothetical protein